MNKWAEYLEQALEDISIEKVPDEHCIEYRIEVVDINLDDPYEDDQVILSEATLSIDEAIEVLKKLKEN